MASEKYNTWNPALYFEVVYGAFTSRALRERTIAFKYIDRARKYDEIEWELDNSDGVLTAIEHLALGLVVRVRIGYFGGTTPWRYFVINKVRGPVGIRDRTNTRGKLAVRRPGRSSARLVFEGRNRNAPLPKNPKKKKFAKPTSAFVAAELNSPKTIKRPRVIWGNRTSDVAKELARRNGFTGPFALIEQTDDQVDGGSRTIPKGMTDWDFLELLASEKDFRVKVDRNGLHWHSDDWGGAPVKGDPREVFTYAGGPDVLDLSVDGDFKLPVPKAVKVRGIDPKNRKTPVQTHHADAIKKGHPNQYSNWAFKGLYGGTGPVISGGMYIRKLEAAQARLETLMKETEELICPDIVAKAGAKARGHFVKRHLAAFKINLKVVGNPAILANHTVRLRGSGSILIDGPWKVWEVRHIFSGQTYVTTMVLRLPPKVGRIKVILSTTAHPDAIAAKHPHQRAAMGYKVGNEGLNMAPAVKRYLDQQQQVAK